MTPSDQHSLNNAAITVLIVLQCVMLGSLFAQVAPHPPARIPLFGMGPFFASSIAIAAAALVLGGSRTRLGIRASWATAALALFSFGPHKWFDPAFAQIWPAVILAQFAAGTIIWITTRRSIRSNPSA